MYPPLKVLSEIRFQIQYQWQIRSRNVYEQRKTFVVIFEMAIAVIHIHIIRLRKKDQLDFLTDTEKPIPHHQQQLCISTRASHNSILDCLHVPGMIQNNVDFCYNFGADFMTSLTILMYELQGRRQSV